MSGDSVDLDHLAGFVLYIFSDARPEYDRTYERGYAAYHMDSAGSCVIVEAQLRKPASAPDPVGLDRIYDKGDNS